MLFSPPLHLKQTLKRLGFATNEVQVMLFLLQKKRATAKSISQQLLISLSSTEYFIALLIEKKLVFREKKIEKNEFYCSVSEEELFLWIKEKKQKASEIYTQAEDELRNYLIEQSSSQWKPTIRYYEGRDGLEEIFDDFLKTNQVMKGWVDMFQLYDVLGDYYDKYRDQKKAQNLFSYEILPKTKDNIVLSEKAPKESRFVENLSFNGDLRVYGNKVALITFEKGKFVGLILEGEIISRLIREIFDHAWENLSEN